MAPITIKQAAICMVAFMVTLLIVAILFSSSADKAIAQEILETAATQKSSTDLEEARDLAEELENSARVMRKWPKAFDSATLMPMFDENNVSFYMKILIFKNSSRFTRILARRLEILAPSTSAEAKAAANAAKRTFKHLADTYDALAKKLRQEADRLERKQKKKN